MTDTKFGKEDGTKVFLPLTPAVFNNLFHKKKLLKIGNSLAFVIPSHWIKWANEGRSEVWFELTQDQIVIKPWKD